MSYGQTYSDLAFSKNPNRNSALLATFLMIAVVCGAAIPVVGEVWVLAGMAAMVVIMATVVDYTLGVWLLVLLLPFSGTSFFPHEMFGITGANPLNLLLGVTLLSAMVRWLWQGTSHATLAYPRLWWAYVAPLALGTWIGSFHIDEIPSFAIVEKIVPFDNVLGYVRDDFIKPLINLIIAILMGLALRDGMKVSTLLIAFCLSVHLFADAIFFHIISHGLGLDILSGAQNRDLLADAVGVHANDIGAYGAFVLTLMMFMLPHNIDRRLRWILSLTAVMAGGLLLISFSRGGFLAFFVGLLAFLISQRRLRVIIASLLIFLALTPLLPGVFYERMALAFNTEGQDFMVGTKDPITAGRVASVWLPLLSEVPKHPLFGNGLDSTAWSDPFRSGKMKVITANPHNLYLKAVLDVGVVGLGLFMLFFIDLWRRFLNVANDPETPPLVAGLFQGGAAALLGYAAYGLSGGDYLPVASNICLWKVLGLLLGQRVSR
jgi:O-antigen ligase